MVLTPQWHLDALLVEGNDLVQNDLRRECEWREVPLGVNEIGTATREQHTIQVANQGLDVSSAVRVLRKWSKQPAR